MSEVRPMLQHVDTRYGPDAAHRLGEAGRPDMVGARAVLETFYYGLNNRDDETLAAVWSPDPLAQLNNPVGGILRGGDAIAELYRRIVGGPVRLTVTLGDIVEYTGPGHAVFAGRETGAYVTAGGEEVPVGIRTTRVLAYVDGRWWQVHHHGSIDDPDALAAYRSALSA